jgi:hypothetical protein
MIIVGIAALTLALSCIIEGIVVWAVLRAELREKTIRELMDPPIF